MWNTNMKIDYIAELVADAVEDYSISRNDGIFDDVIKELKEHFKNCDEDEIMEILSLCVSVYGKKHNETAELVVTFPDSFRVKSKKTEAVVYSLINEAEKSITMTGYSISDFFSEMLDIIIKKSQQGVYITLYINDLERQKEVLERLLSYQSKFLKIYEFQKDAEDKMAALHAKVLVIDRKVSLVSSANLSYHGMQGNIEMGILLQSQEKAKKIEALLKELKKMKVFNRISRNKGN